MVFEIAAEDSAGDGVVTRGGEGFQGLFTRGATEVDISQLDEVMHPLASPIKILFPLSLACGIIRHAANLDWTLV